tara:strand:- start:142 stop:405 length:264 start_codon:yes stop_codon:yes gene_type:complete
MSKQSFEQKQLDQINKTESVLSEGFIASVILRALYGSRAKKIFKRAAKVAKNKPELQAAMSDLKTNTERIKDLLDRHCKEFPDSKNC